MGYEARDWEIVDYQLYDLEPTGLQARGPRPTDLQDGRFIAFLGAAQTFGAFCEKPFPALVQEQLGIPTLNLGYGGIGPSFYLKHPELIDLVNRAGLVVVQVMSGRSVGNSLLESTGTDHVIRRSDGKSMSAKDAFREVIEQDLGWWKLRGKRHVAQVMGSLGRLKAKQLVQENRANYLKEYEELFTRITPPKVLLWFSKRSPDYHESYDRVEHVFGSYPQLINRPMVNALRQTCSDYVECVTSRGSPQRLISRFTGQPVTIRHSDARADLDATPQTHNDYYPSPQMHEDAAAALTPVCQRLLQTR